MKTFRLFLLLLALPVLVESCAVYAQPGVYVAVRPTPVRFTPPPPPSPAHIWIEGDYVVRGNAYVWQNGYWAAPHPRQHWVAGSWASHPRGYFWISGRWSR